MPSYSYICQTCGMEFEKHLSITANHDNVKCPKGHALTQRVYFAPRVSFKGSGFYATDNKKSAKTPSFS